MAVDGSICNICKEFKPRDQFYVDKTARGYGYSCKPCSRQKANKWHHSNKDKAKENQLQRKFGLSLNEYNEKLKSQNYSCAICGRSETAVRFGNIKNLAVDHNRKCCSGDVSCGKCLRGLLCDWCNKAIGYVREDLQVAERLVEYLRLHKMESVVK